MDIKLVQEVAAIYIIDMFIYIFDLPFITDYAKHFLLIFNSFIWFDHKQNERSGLVEVNRSDHKKFCQQVCFLIWTDG